MKYFFNIENLHYLRYKLRCITSLTKSLHVYHVYVPLKEIAFEKSWDVSLDELKQILDCDKVETYKEFKEFNKQVLKTHPKRNARKRPSVSIHMSQSRKGRTVVGIRFEVETLPKLEVKSSRSASAERRGARSPDVGSCIERMEVITGTIGRASNIARNSANS